MKIKDSYQIIANSEQLEKLCYGFAYYGYDLEYAIFDLLIIPFDIKDGIMTFEIDLNEVRIDYLTLNRIMDYADNPLFKAI